MRNREEQHEDDELSTILKLAIQKEDSFTGDLHQRIAAIAHEMGISPEAVEKAETEYRQKSSRDQELALYIKEKRDGLNLHSGIFFLGSLFFMGFNLMTWGHDKKIWFPYFLLMWGFGLAVHAFIALRKIDWDNDKFQTWRRKRQ